VSYPRTQSKPLSKAIAGLMMLLGTALFLLGPVLPAWAGESRAHSAMLQGSATVSLDPSDPEVDVGDTVDVEVVVEDVVDLFYVELYVTYDPELLEVVDADSDEAGVQIEPGPFLGADATVDTNEVDQEDGDILFVQEASTDAVSGDGTLATISFRGKAPGTSDITIDDEVLYPEDETADALTATVQSGTITVVGDVTATVTAEIKETPTLEATAKPTLTPKPSPGESPTDTPVPTSRPTFTPEPVAPFEARTMQLWPDRSVGVSSDQMEGLTSYVDTQVLPFGHFDLSGGEFVESRTYLHFPINAFPLGTDVKRATLHVYVDSGLGDGAEGFGVYRVLEPWAETRWSEAPSSWPALLSSPVAITEVSLGAEASRPGSRATLKLARVMGDSPLPTPGLSVLPTPSLTFTPAPQPTADATQTPTPQPESTAMPTATPGSAPPPSMFALEETPGRWIVWDVTALVRGWVLEEADDYGLAVALAPDPDAGPGEMGNLILARLLSAEDVNTEPYIVANVEIYPVTPTPTPTPIPILPPAGSRTPAGWGGIGVSLLGALMLMTGLGLALRRRTKG
jgi:hypothetical protein